MQFFFEIGKGITSYYTAHQLIKKKGWWLFVLLPGILHITILFLVFLFAWTFSANLLNLLLQGLGVGLFWEGASSFLQILHTVLLWTLRLLLVTVYLLMYKQVVLIVCAPLLAYLSQITESTLTNTNSSFHPKQFIKDVFRGILIALRNLTLELGWMILIYAAMLLPVIGLLGPFLLFIIQSYFYGFSMIDYYLERQQLSVKESVHYMKKHRGIAIGNGLVFFGLMAIPVIGWLIAPVYSVIAATLAVHQVNSTSYE